MCLILDSHCHCDFCKTTNRNYSKLIILSHIRDIKSLIDQFWIIDIQVGKVYPIRYI